uniref:Uncharacterized protein n=1 Tax=Arundo donax TaxID=35708 RepID=A0A0A9GF51_ARUDO
MGWQQPCHVCFTTSNVSFCTTRWRPLFVLLGNLQSQAVSQGPANSLTFVDSTPLRDQSYV